MQKTKFLSDLVEEERLNSHRSSIQRIDITELDYFPILDYTQLLLYVCGTYQIKVARSYYVDHLDVNGDFEFQIAKETTQIDYCKYSIDLRFENSLLLKVRIRSRHSN